MAESLANSVRLAAAPAAYALQRPGWPAGLAVLAGFCIPGAGVGLLLRRHTLKLVDAVLNRPPETVTALQDGRIFAIRHQPMPDGGWVATHEDITPQRHTQAQIERLA